MHRSHKDCRKSAARSSRIREKALRLRDQVKQSAVVLFERRQARLGWWQRAFGEPKLVGRWIFSQAKTLWAALMTLLGLHPESFERPTYSFKRRRSYRHSYGRRVLLIEGMEQRQLLAIDVAVVGDIGSGNNSGFAATVNRIGELRTTDSYCTAIIQHRLFITPEGPS